MRSISAFVNVDTSRAVVVETGPVWAAARVADGVFGFSQISANTINGADGDSVGTFIFVDACKSIRVENKIVGTSTRKSAVGTTVRAANYETISNETVVSSRTVSALFVDGARVRTFFAFVNVDTGVTGAQIPLVSLYAVTLISSRSEPVECSGALHLETVAVDAVSVVDAAADVSVGETFVDVDTCFQIHIDFSTGGTGALDVSVVVFNAAVGASEGGTVQVFAVKSAECVDAGLRVWTAVAVFVAFIDVDADKSIVDKLVGEAGGAVTSVPIGHWFLHLTD